MKPRDGRFFIRFGFPQGEMAQLTATDAQEAAEKLSVLHCDVIFEREGSEATRPSRDSAPLRTAPPKLVRNVHWLETNEQLIRAGGDMLSGEPEVSAVLLGTLNEVRLLELGGQVTVYLRDAKEIDHELGNGSKSWVLSQLTQATQNAVREVRSWCRLAAEIDRFSRLASRSAELRSAARTIGAEQPKSERP